MRFLNKTLPYYLFILSYFLFFWPSYYPGKQLSLSLGPVDLYPLDISLLVLASSCILLIMNWIIKRQTYELRLIYSSVFIWVIIAFFVFLLAKFIIEVHFSISNIRNFLGYFLGYLWVIFFPVFVDSYKSVRLIVIIGMVFSVYICLLHFYKFALYGYILHALGGTFLLFTIPILFAGLFNYEYLNIKLVVVRIVNMAILTAMFMAGHRSAFVALIASLLVLLYLRGFKIIRKEIVLMVPLSLALMGLVTLYNPSIVTKAFDRASTTFDSQQKTYQGRIYNNFKMIKRSMRHPIIGSPFIEKKTGVYEPVKIKSGNITYTSTEALIVPHNIIIAWLLYYGIIGLLLGLAVIGTSFLVFFKFLKKYKGQTQKFNWGVSMLCAWIFNLVFALCNALGRGEFHILFMYFPVILLLSVEGVLQRSTVSGDR